MLKNQKEMWLRGGRAGKVARPILPKIIALAFLITWSVILILFADRQGNGFGPDVLNSIVPMFHLDAVKNGELIGYRYAWQPLSYELGAIIFQLTKTPTPIFLLPPIASAVSLALLLAIIWRDRASLKALAVSLVALLAVPEIVFSGLYYNATILGLPFAIGSLALLHSRPGTAMTLVASLLASVAILMRLDFILVCPALAVVAWQQDRTFERPIVLACGVLGFLGLAFLIGWLRPKEVIEIYQLASAEIAAKAHMGGWDLREKMGALSVLFSPLGWVLLLLGGPLVIYQALKRDPTTTIIWMVAMTPLMIPLLNSLTPKYGLPLAIFVPTFLVQCLSAIEARLSQGLRPWLLGLSALGTAALLFLSFSIAGKSPFVQIGTLASRQVGTHNGARSYGGYLWQIAYLHHRSETSPKQASADQIFRDFLDPNGPDLVVAGRESGGVGWRFLQLAFEQSGIHGEVVAPDQIRFDLNDRRLTLAQDVFADTIARLDRGRGIKFYDFRENGQNSPPDGWQRLQ